MEEKRKLEREIQKLVNEFEKRNKDFQIVNISVEMPKFATLGQEIQKEVFVSVYVK